MWGAADWLYSKIIKFSLDRERVKCLFDVFIKGNAAENDI
jgi:hypothetical protein